jgi:peptidoglycan/xylan/chitin deacetylase (PgdA/CDA1 family)
VNVSPTRPEASVLIAAHNRHAALQPCLRALDGQTQDPSTFEVVVVDAGSTDATPQLLVGLETRFALRAVQLDEADVTAALATAVAESRGRVCIFLGTDVVATPELIRVHLAVHATNERLVGIGRLVQEVPNDRDWYVRAQAIAWNRRSESWNEHSLGWPDVHAENLSVARSALAEVGGLTGAGAEGPAAITELAFRLELAGYVARYLAAAQGVRRSERHGRQLLTERAHEGAAHAELSIRNQAMTPRLLGWFTDTTPREVLFRRLVLALRVRPAMLAALGRLLPGDGRKQLWFTFVSNFAYWDAVRKRLARDDWRQLARGLPVLLYHAFSECDQSSRFVVARRMFARQMRILSLLRFNVLPYGEFARSIREGRLPPPRTVVLTIDDGYADNGKIAAAILERHGFGATIFLVSGRLGAVNDWSDAAPLRGRELLSVQQLDPLRDRGIEFGAHTLTHPCLPDVADEAVAEEVESSRFALEEALSTPIRTFAYPYGQLDDRTLAAVQRAGFLSACTTEPRLARLDDHPLLIPRLEIKGGDSLWRFLLKVWFGWA